MGSPLKSSYGNTPVRVTLVKDAGHSGRITRVALWLVNVAIPKLIPDHLTPPGGVGARRRRPAGANRSSARPSPGQPRPDKSRRAHPMSSTAKFARERHRLQTTLEEDVPYVGLMTRLLS
jgi:hypothetical protein